MPLAKQSREDFLDYACHIKTLELNQEDSEACLRFLKDPTKPQTPYLSALYGVFSD